MIIAGKQLPTTPVFDTYWRFAVARQELYFARLRGATTSSGDAILAAHRFTNCYRAADRISQYCISEVIYQGSQNLEDIVLRILLFKLFNKIETWKLLQEHFDSITWDNWQLNEIQKVLDKAWKSGQRLYSAAYLMPSPQLGSARKYQNHLLLVENMMRQGLPHKLGNACSLQEVFRLLRSYPGLGDFLAYQFTIDLNYSTIFDFSENEFVVAGPGAKDGIRKCFGSNSAGIENAIISYMTENQSDQFDRLGLKFNWLGGRPLQLIDCQNLFCEVDKYSRLAHPEIIGVSGRSRIKQRYRRDPRPLSTPWFPPKWGINDAVCAQLVAPAS